MNRIKQFLQNSYRYFNRSKRADLVWQDLKAYMTQEDYRHAVSEKDRYIEIAFSISEQELLHFYYFIDQENDRLKLTVTVYNQMPEDQIEVFMKLVAHFNSLLRVGIVRFDFNDRRIIYEQSESLLVCVLEPFRIANLLHTHYTTAKDLVWAIDELTRTGEDPVFIISELLKKYEEKSD